MAKQRGIFWLSLVDQDYESFQSEFPVIFERPAEHFHITLQYNVPLTEEIAQFLWKAPIPVTVRANCYNHRIQAVRVNLPEHFQPLCQNANPHMTISMVNGARPVQSNAMLDSTHVEQELEATLLFRAEFRHFT
jgi:hypothetical protein